MRVCEDAYDAFEQKMPPPDMGGTDLKDIPEKRRKRREGRGLSGQDPDIDFGVETKTSSTAYFNAFHHVLHSFFISGLHQCMPNVRIQGICSFGRW